MESSGSPGALLFPGEASKGSPLPAHPLAPFQHLSNAGDSEQPSLTRTHHPSPSHPAPTITSPSVSYRPGSLICWHLYPIYAPLDASINPAAFRNHRFRSPSCVASPELGPEAGTLVVVLQGHGHVWPLDPELPDACGP